MRPVRALPLSLAALALLPPAALATEQGGAAAPIDSGGPPSGGAVSAPQASAPPEPAPRRHRTPRRSGRRGRGGPLLTDFTLLRPSLFLYGRPARVDFTITARARTVRVRLSFVPTGERKPVSTISLGDRPTGVSQSVFLTGRETGVLPQGHYTLRIAASDSRGRRLRRGPHASSVADLAFFYHRFPLAGPFNYGDEGARFGAPRPGHKHQGQDVIAAEGTPIVAPRGGVIKAVQYQAGGAGYYVVLDGAGEDMDYVFMHLRAGSTRVRQGQRVRTGQRLGDVGNTGSSFGPHLHFEIWVGGGWFTGGHPVDPLPFLEAWNRWS